MYLTHGAQFNEVFALDAVSNDVKAIYGADTLKIAEAYLENFDEV